MYTASLTFSNSTFCPHSVSMCFVWIWEQTVIISLYSIIWLVCIAETECVYCAVRTGCLYIIKINRMAPLHSKIFRIDWTSHAAVWIQDLKQNLQCHITKKVFHLIFRKTCCTSVVSGHIKRLRTDNKSELHWQINSLCYNLNCKMQTH